MNPASLQQCHSNALAASGRLRLPLRSRVWRGQAGGRIILVDPHGYTLKKDLPERKPIQGKSITTSLDIELQLGRHADRRGRVARSRRKLGAHRTASCARASSACVSPAIMRAQRV